MKNPIQTPYEPDSVGGAAGVAVWVNEQQRQEIERRSAQAPAWAQTSNALSEGKNALERFFTGRAPGGGQMPQEGDLYLQDPSERKTRGTYIYNPPPAPSEVADLSALTESGRADPTLSGGIFGRDEFSDIFGRAADISAQNQQSALKRRARTREETKKEEKVLTRLRTRKRRIPATYADLINRDIPSAFTPAQADRINRHFGNLVRQSSTSGGDEELKAAADEKKSLDVAMGDVDLEPADIRYDR